MALARFGGGVSELRGSIAGNVFSRSRAGAIVRNRAVPVNPNTVSQSLVRMRMQTVADNFKALTKTAVENWNTFAQTQERINRLGETYTPSGKQLFTETNLNLLIIDAGASPPSLADLVTDPNLPGLTGYTIDVETAAGPVLSTAEFNGTGTSNATHVVVQATPPLLPSYSNGKKFMREIAVLPLPAVSQDLAAAYIAVFGNGGPEGNVIMWRARAVSEDSGLGGEWIYDTTVIPEVT